MTNFSNPAIYLLSHEVVETSSEHLQTLVEFHLSQADVFRLIPDNRDTKFRKRHTILLDI